MPVSRLPFELEIITGPLRRVFQTRTLKATLPILPILAIRFDLTFHSILDVIDWTREFRTDLAVYKTLIADDPVKQLAMKATMSDKQGFDLLCPAGFKKRDIHLIRLNYQSNAITTGLAECCMAHPPLMYRVREMAEVSNSKHWCFTRLTLVQGIFSPLQLAPFGRDPGGLAGSPLRRVHFAGIFRSDMSRRQLCCLPSSHESTTRPPLPTSLPTTVCHSWRSHIERGFLIRIIQY